MYSINEQGEERILLIFSPNTAFPIFPGVMEQPHYKIKYFYETMDDAELYLVPKQQFGKLLACNDEAARLALEYVTGMAGDLVRRLGIIENKDAKNKIASLLHYLIKIGSREIKPNQYKVKFRLTHQDIAALSGITRETASIQIKNLEDDGVISQKKDGLLLINQELIPV